MKYIRFGKWLFSSVVCLSNKDELSQSKTTQRKMKDRGQESYEQQLS